MLPQGLKGGEGITLCHLENIGKHIHRNGDRTKQCTLLWTQHTMPKDSSKGKEWHYLSGSHANGVSQKLNTCIRKPNKL